MKITILLIKAFLNFIYTLLTPFIAHKYKLSFTKDDVGNWRIDIKNWPSRFYDNLLMVAGADKLCDFFDDGTRKARVEVIASNRKLKQCNLNIYVRYDRIWAYLKWGGQYKLAQNNITDINEMWLCQVTLFVLGWWPKYIYIKKL